MTMFNAAFPQRCPGCDGLDVCYDDCICPMCWAKRKLTEVSVQEASDWLELAPAFNMLTDAGVKVSWSSGPKDINGNVQYSLMLEKAWMETHLGIFRDANNRSYWVEERSYDDVNGPDWSTFEFKSPSLIACAAAMIARSVCGMGL